MATAHSFTAHSTIGTNSKHLRLDVLKGLTKKIGDLIGRLYLQSVVIDYSDCNFLIRDRFASGLKVHSIRTLHLESNQVGINLIQNLESRFVRLNLIEHPLLRWIAPTRVAPDLGLRP